MRTFFQARRYRAPVHRDVGVPGVLRERREQLQAGGVNPIQSAAVEGDTGAGGPALGTLGLPPSELYALATRAGFHSVTEVAIASPINSLYVLRT